MKSVNPYNFAATFKNLLTKLKSNKIKKNKQKMTDKIGNKVELGDTVAILHKKRSTTTSTLQVGVIKSFLNKNTAVIAIEGLNDSRNKQQTIIKLK